MATSIKPTAAAPAQQAVKAVVTNAKPAATAVVQTTVTTKVSKLAKGQALLFSGASYAWNSRPATWIRATANVIANASRYALAHSPELMAFGGVAISAARVFHFYKPDAVVASKDHTKPDGFLKRAYLYVNSNEGHTALSNALVLTLTVALVAINRFSK